MSKNILFISAQKIKDESVALDNIDDKFIIPQIKYCQDAYLEPVLGTLFFDGLQTRISDGTTTDAEKTLIKDYIHDALIYFVLSELPLQTSFKFWSNGVLQKSGDNATAPSMTELQRIAQEYKNKAEFYLARLVAHLEENEDAYDEYRNSIANEESRHPSRSAYKTSIYLG